MSEQYNNPGNQKIINPYSPLETYNRGPCGVGIQAPTWVGIQNVFKGYPSTPGHPNTVYRTMCVCDNKPYNYTVNDTCKGKSSTRVTNALPTVKSRKDVDYGFNKSIR